MKKPINIPIVALFVTLFAWSFGVTSGATAQSQLQNLPSPAPSNSSLSRVVANESGEIYLSWVSQDAGQATLAYSRLSSEGWNTPKVISQGSDWFVNWADRGAH